MGENATVRANAAVYSTANPEEYLRNRVEFKIEAYRKKGQMYRWFYLTTATVSCVAAALVPVLINRPGVGAVYPESLSLLVTVLVGVEGVFHWRDHWKSYDLMKSFLRQEAFLYGAGAGVYSGKTLAEAFTLFVERVEGQIAKERLETVQMRTASNGPAQGDSGSGRG